MVIEERAIRARAIVKAGSVEQALASGTLPNTVSVTLAEAVVIGLLKQDVKIFVGIFGHGSTDLGEVMRVYEREGALRTHAVRNEVEAAHIATALRWSTGEKAAVFTSIGPGAVQALAGSLAASSDGVGVWHIYADETTEAEGPNMQQIPDAGQEAFLRLASAMGPAYTLHTPWALPEALRRGMNAVDHPHRARPFFLLLPINTQPQLLTMTLGALPSGPPPALGAAADNGAYEQAARALIDAERVVVRVGGGARGAGPEIQEILDLVDGFAVTSPIASGTLPYEHPRNLTVGGSKGSISGNFAMEQGDVLLAIGTRGVCQSDMSRTGYPRVTRVVNVNTDPADAVHYNHAIPLLGDARATLRGLIDAVKQLGAAPHDLSSPWAVACMDAWEQWVAFKEARYRTPVLEDEVWQRPVLTQPAALKAVNDWARSHDDAVLFYDAGDVQANGFQVAEDDRVGRTITETGASYMGFSTSAIVATGIASSPFFGVSLTGDGSFTMNPQALIDGVQHGARGVIVVFDNRRQGAISSLQLDQYGIDYATNDQVEVDYRAWAAAVGGVQALHGGTSTAEFTAALDAAYDYDGLSLIHVPVYFGSDPLGGFGSFGRWNVGPWVAKTEALRHELEI
ncbi:thiamine pyrophosphate-dependent enzyme [Leucobacter luti]|uniref:3D-(3,5/4)-trihydroxycyclohexane-1,2-dione acylhydrolase (Decyclizing) n=1 Tax=Leucobacter luti TaxID=340320 RepID=A0A4Q7U7F1_9MICO|nr:thiamine pyrophosphate-dependent enzyme [Leucobacter luti]MBL3700781.1 thiamine pyrophosphate-binding protein [Leucobacter luti]RZT68382.1 3D-(3,5/4)-trihydroxycyclohexane-1,2-dione acylhydrolase (decyclizing) [Leucobacter luti]